MTTVLDLAKQISNVSKATRAYAIEQATQFLSLQGEVRVLQEQVGTLEAEVRMLQERRATSWPSALADFGGDLQRMVDVVPDGTLCWLEPHVYDVPTGGLDLSAKQALSLFGAGGVGHNEGGRWGAVLRQPVDGQPVLVDNGFGASVKHNGPKLQNITFYAPGKDVIGARFRQTNHIGLHWCSFQGGMAVAIDADVPVSQYDQGDDAYNDLDNVTWAITQPDATGFRLGDGYWTMRACNSDMAGMKPTAIKNLRGVIDMTDCKLNHAGYHVYSSGAGMTMKGCQFEIAPWTPTYAITVERGTNVLPGAGCRHVIVGNTMTPHADPDGHSARIAYFASGTFGNVYRFNTAIYNDSQSIVNLAGAANDVDSR
jgi:hypothetical protein